MIRLLTLTVGAQVPEFKVKSKQKVKFKIWLNQAALIALNAEWTINPAYPRWMQWFKAGLTPHEAVTCLFELVRRGDE